MKKFVFVISKKFVRDTNKSWNNASLSAEVKSQQLVKLIVTQGYFDLLNTIDIVHNHVYIHHSSSSFFILLFLLNTIYPSDGTNGGVACQFLDQFISGIFS